MNSNEANKLVAHNERCERCAKCGVTSYDDSSLAFHRFPLPSIRYGSLRTKVWAMYCFPDEDWTCDEKLKKLYKAHKVLCSKHFDDSSYTSSDRKRLNKFAIPSEAQSILSQSRQEQNNPPTDTNGFDGEQDNSSIFGDLSVQMEVDVITTTGQKEDKRLETDTRVYQKVKGIFNNYNAKKLSRRKKKLLIYRRGRENISEILTLIKKLQLLKKSKTDVLTSMSCCDSLKKLLDKNLSSKFYVLQQKHLKQIFPQNLIGQKWSLDDKIIALSFYKKSRACYKLLDHLLCLPSTDSLKALLNTIPLDCGINTQIMDTLKEITSGRHFKDNLCVLAFDKMEIKKILTYNSKLEQLGGIQGYRTQRRRKAVALTFMAIGIYKKWKQPIAFYFCEDSVKSNTLSALVKEVVSACIQSGLEVVSTVCGVDDVNIQAINLLGSTIDKPYFMHEGHEIVTILDPPHLLKCFRNIFLSHDIKFIQDGTQSEVVARWKDIEEFYEKDKENAVFVFAPALAQQHLQPNEKQKMRLCLAAQVLSHSVAAGIYAKVFQNELTPDAQATAAVVSNMDKLFDCMNGDTLQRKRGKPHLTVMSLNSPHLQFFQKMKHFFTEMEFIGLTTKPPAQEGWLMTINAVEKLSKNMKKLEIRSLPTRRLNLDPLENWLRYIRSNCDNSPVPTSNQYIEAVKTSIVTNLLNISRNCLDDNHLLLNNFKSLLSWE